ncbi:FIG00702062: hypothetical protein [hydrothermal vent metagenome]|uniref:ATPase n=1 Tax=hydrothermal vent metagenome TaxID=652676 RepID=A0A3B0ZF53_9ZZZZ
MTLLKIIKFDREKSSLFALFLLLLLVGCIGGPSTTSNPVTSNSNAAKSYTGPVPATTDVKAFMDTVWQDLKSTNRCGNCHVSGNQTPFFVRNDDVNLAYSATINLVNLSSPEDSRLVTKVAEGHNCWLDSDSACAAVITAYIQSWGGGTGVGAINQVKLVAPVQKNVGETKNFPVNAPAAFTTLHTLLRTNCAECHVESATIPQSPYFSNSNVNLAYEASQAKIDLNNAANSRFVVRLRSEFHNCWSGNCQTDAQEMEDAIRMFVDPIPLTQVDPDLVISKALKLTEGLIASGGSRYENNLIALYQLKTAEGDTLFDTSGVSPELHLQLSGIEGVDYKWVGGWGIEFVNSKAQGLTSASKKLSDSIKLSGEYSIEAWLVPGNVTQEGPAGIISYSAGTAARNFTLGQTLYNYDFLHRSSTTNANGEPALSTADADEVLQATQQHVVITFDAITGRKIYVNGTDTGAVDETGPGNMSDWDDSFAFVLGNEVSNNRPWKGKLRLVAVHSRALTPGQIQQNFSAGVGERFFLLFNVSEHLPEVTIAATGAISTNSYIMFEVSQFDSYSYLFSEPKFINLDAGITLDSIPVAGLRIGINGREATSGQAYPNLSTTLDNDNYTDIDGQQLSALGTVIALEKGPDQDEFFLTFERLGAETNVVIEAAPTAPAAPPDADPVSDIGLRTFEEISNSMSIITGVSTTESNVATTYESIKQQLPTVENIDGFLSSHQVAIAQMAIEYCNALVESTSLRATFFPGFDFSANAATAFDTQGERDLVTNPLLAKGLGINLSTQPGDAAVKTELENLIAGLTVCGGGCAADRSAVVVKAACAATLGSAAILVQ